MCTVLETSVTSLHVSFENVERFFSYEVRLKLYNDAEDDGKGIAIARLLYFK